MERITKTITISAEEFQEMIYNEYPDALLTGEPSEWFAR